MNITLRKKRFILILLFNSIIACAPQQHTKTQHPAKTLTAIGYGTFAPINNVSLQQRRLMSMRASRMDAYRNLAEQVNGIHINGQSSVADMVLKNDQYKTYINSFLQGAKVRSITEISSYTFETVIEIKLSKNFYHCMDESPANNQQCLEQPNSARQYSLSEPDSPINTSHSSGYYCNAADCSAFPHVQGFSN